MAVKNEVRAVHATLPTKLYNDLVAQAKAEERTVSVVVMRAVREYLANQPVAATLFPVNEAALD